MFDNDLSLSVLSFFAGFGVREFIYYVQTKVKRRSKLSGFSS